MSYCYKPRLLAREQSRVLEYAQYFALYVIHYLPPRTALVGFLPPSLRGTYLPTGIPPIFLLLFLRAMSAPFGYLRRVIPPRVVRLISCMLHRPGYVPVSFASKYAFVAASRCGSACI